MNQCILGVGLPSRDTVPTLAKSFGHSHSIPVWQPPETGNNPYPIPIRHVAAFTNSCPIPIRPIAALRPQRSNVERLKQFCDFSQTKLAPTVLQDPFSPDSHTVRINRLTQLVGFTVGISLCLNTPTSSDSTLGNVLNLTNSQSAGSAKAAASLPSPSQIPSLALIAPTAPTVKVQMQAVALSSKRFSPQFIKPVEGFPLTSPFGNRIHPISGKLRFHEGIDFGTPEGTPIQASKKGVVVFAGWDGGYGRTVIINHAGNYETLYAHLEQVLVNEGDSVTQGETIGLSGNTGYSTGPHLHFEIRADQVARNPLSYFSSPEVQSPIASAMQKTE
jgi:hypothetical protein